MPSYPREIYSANGTKKRVPFFAAATMPGCAATHLQGQNKNAYYNKFWLEAQHPAGLLSVFFEFAGQQKSAGLMVDETNKPAHCFLYIIFSDFSALFALK